MIKKIFYFFLFFFLIVLAMGCIGNGNGETTEHAVNGLSPTILIGGVESNRIELVTGQRTELGLNLKNLGEREIENVNSKLIGCLEVETEFDNDTEEIPPGTEYYFNWRVKPMDLGRGERINCDSFFRICFDYTTESYSDVIAIPEGYGVPPSPFSTTTGEYLNVLYNIEPTRIIDGEENRIVGEIIIRNVGTGAIDYVDYIDNPSRNILRTIEIELEGLEGAKIVRLGGDPIENIEDDDGIQILEDGTKIIIDYNGLDNVHLLRTIRGHEIRNRIEIKIPEDYSCEYQESLNIGELRLRVNNGYCIDTSPISVTMRG